MKRFLQFKAVQGGMKFGFLKVEYSIIFLKKQSIIAPSGIETQRLLSATHSSARTQEACSDSDPTCTSQPDPLVTMMIRADMFGSR